MSKIIGREKQQEELQMLCEKKEAVFLALYGRRRVGKTYLINQYFNDQFAFKHTGVYTKDRNNQTQIQLDYFVDSLIKYGAKIDGKITTWREAFNELEKLIKSKKGSDKKVIFIDEMPWLDTEDSMFIPAFAHFWNDFASCRDDILLIACGSATTWMANKLVHNKDDLYKRVTYEIKLEPLSLKEVEELLQSNNIDYHRYQIVQLYMILGGVPMYLKYLNAQYTLEQNIDNLFFQSDGKLRNEFNELFESTFEQAAFVKRIVRVISESKEGLTKDEIVKKLNRQPGGDLSRTIDSLIDSGFILKYKSFKTSERAWRFKLIDPFCLFYLSFVEKHDAIDAYFWSKNFAGPKIRSWQGNAFENICFYHIDQIKEKIGIRGVDSEESLLSVRGDDEGRGSQIDLIILRKDNVIDICEAKFYGDIFAPDKDDYDKAIYRESLVAERLSKRYIIHHVLLTTFGVKDNKYSYIYRNIVTIDDLFNN